MPVYFPQLAGGITTQRPYATVPEFKTAMVDMPTGRRYAYYKWANPLGRFEINCPSITDADLST